ncbi:MAG: twin-arginine translocase subunit TatC [Fuerstiella sp.]
MTFGEHLEVLRVHVWKALLGLAVGVVISLLYGNQIIGILKEPINEALRKNNMSEATDDVGNMDIVGLMKDWWAGKEPEPVIEEPTAAPIVDDEMLVQVPIDNLKQAIEQAVPGTIVQLPADPPDKLKEASNKADSESDLDGGDHSATISAVQDADQTPTVWLQLKSEEIGLLRSLIDQANSPIAHKVEEAFMTYIKVSVVAGFVIASPWIFFQVWQFVAAGLFPHERKHVYRFLPMSLGLFFIGAIFCFQFVFPIVLDFLIGFNKWLGVVLRPRLSEYISFALLLPVMFGISFQLPLVMLLIERIGIITVEGFIKNWRMAVLIIAVASMLLTPSDPSSMLLMMFPLIILYFGGIMLCKIKPKENVDPLA